MAKPDTIRIQMSRLNAGASVIVEGMSTVTAMANADTIRTLTKH